MNTEKVENVAGKLKTVTIAADGATVKLAGLVFSESEVLSLLRSLLQPEAAQETR